MPDPRKAGFTLIELLVVMAIIATLLTIVAPRYMGSIDRSKETALKENLNTLRQSIDKYYGDNGQYPATLDALVEKRYIRQVPLDPITERNDSWVTSPPPDKGQTGVYDVHSGAAGKASDGRPYAEW
jgi:type II secretion system protein G